MEDGNNNSETVVTKKSLEFLVSHVFKNVYRSNPGSIEGDGFLDNCIELFAQDHAYTLLDNSGGFLCGHYPSKIIIPLLGNEESNPPTRGLGDLVSSSRSARCRSRFVVPVIAFKGKYICRSATLSGGPEIYLRRFIDVFSNNNNNNNNNGNNNNNNNNNNNDGRRDVSMGSFNELKNGLGRNGDDNDAGGKYKGGGGSSCYNNNNNNHNNNNNTINSSGSSNINRDDNNNNNNANNGSSYDDADDNDTINPTPDSLESSSSVVFSKVRNQDIRLLKRLNISHIIDLMVEKKKVKYFLNVTSSEKVDKENRYGDFDISSMPYPGCEFFRQWKDNNYNPEGILFDWTQDFVDAELKLPTHPSPPSHLQWSLYKTWNLNQLTQNYVKLILHYVINDTSGLLIHCISGWDRTPLFVSLVRLSLWADGLIHSSLSPLQILYFTIAYDWFLFGHNFPNRYDKGEEVFYFCFHFLHCILSEEFSVVSETTTSPTTSLKTTSPTAPATTSPTTTTTTSPTSTSTFSLLTTLTTIFSTPTTTPTTTPITLLSSTTLSTLTTTLPTTIETQTSITTISPTQQPTTQPTTSETLLNPPPTPTDSLTTPYSPTPTTTDSLTTPYSPTTTSTTIELQPTTTQINTSTNLEFDDNKNNNNNNDNNNDSNSNNNNNDNNSNNNNDTNSSLINSDLSTNSLLSSPTQLNTTNSTTTTNITTPNSTTTANIETSTTTNTTTTLQQLILNNTATMQLTNSQSSHVSTPTPTTPPPTTTTPTTTTTLTTTLTTTSSDKTTTNNKVVKKCKPTFDRRRRLTQVILLFESVYLQQKNHHHPSTPPIPPSFIQVGLSSLMNNLGFGMNKGTGVEC